MPFLDMYTSKFENIFKGLFQINLEAFTSKNTILDSTFEFWYDMLQNQGIKHSIVQNLWFSIFVFQNIKLVYI